MKNFLSILIIFGLFMTLGIKTFADDAVDAKTFFNTYITAANTYNQSLLKMYSPTAKIIRQVVKPDGTLVNVATNTSTYITQMKLSQSIAKMRNYKNTYRNISITKVTNGYKISAERQPTGEKYWLKTYQIVKKQQNGSWIIVEELMQTKEQVFLKYAK